MTGEQRELVRRARDRQVRRRLGAHLGLERRLGLRCAGCDGGLDSLTAGCATCVNRWRNYREGRRAGVEPELAARVMRDRCPPVAALPIGGVWAPPAGRPRGHAGHELIGAEWGSWTPARPRAWSA